MGFVEERDVRTLLQNKTLVNEIIQAVAKRCRNLRRMWQTRSKTCWRMIRAIAENFSKQLKVIRNSRRRSSGSWLRRSATSQSLALGGVVQLCL